MMANQLDLSLPVTVCAWCKPKERGSGLGQLSHGICPGHLRKIKMELQGVDFKRRARKRFKSGNEGMLPL